MKRTITLCLSACLFFLYISPINAAVMLQSGLFHEHSASLGSTITGSFRFVNTGKRWGEIKLYQEDMLVKGNGDINYIPATDKAHPRSNSSWIRLESDRITLRPNVTQTMIYTIKVPDNPALHGTYWSIVYLMPVSKKSRESQLARQPSNNGKKVFTIFQQIRYAVQILVHVGNRGKPNLDFVAPRIEKTGDGQRNFVFDVKNSGIRYSRPDIWLEVFGLNGDKQGKFESKRQGLYPGTRKTFNIDISKLKPSQYKALLAAEDNNTGQIFGSDINLKINP